VCVCSGGWGVGGGVATIGLPDFTFRVSELNTKHG